MKVKSFKKILFIILGLISLGIGVLGTILPVLPGGPFYLLAWFLFTKSSERLEKWFRQTKMYEKYVIGFLYKKGMTRKEKIRINVIADTFILISVFLVDILFVQILIIAVGLYKHYYFIRKIPTIVPGEEVHV